MKLPRRAVLGNQDQVPTGGNPPVQAHPFSQQPLDPVSNDGVPHFLGDRHPEATADHRAGPPPREREDMSTMQLGAAGLHREELGALSQPHLLRDARRPAARHGGATLLLGDRDRDALASLGAPSTKDFTSSAGFLACAKPVGPLAALVVRLVGTLHGLLSTLRGAGSILKRGIEVKPASLSSVRARFPTRFRSSLPRVFSLQREFAVCYQRQVSSPVGRPLAPAAGGRPEVPVDNFWKGCTLSVRRLR